MTYTIYDLILEKRRWTSSFGVFLPVGSPTRGVVLFPCRAGAGANLVAFNFTGPLIQSSVKKKERSGKPSLSGCDNPPRKIPYYRLKQSTLVI
jgi:hypothetical protein